MDKVKSYFNRKAADRRFKKAGRGQTLGDSAPAAAVASSQSAAASLQTKSASASRRSKPTQPTAAALAAERRLQEKAARGKPTPEALARAALLEEQRAAEAMLGVAAQQGSSPAPPSHQRESTDDPHALQVRVECPLSGALVPEADVMNHLATVLQEMLETSPLDMSVKLIHTLCLDKEQRERCITVLCKYVRNVLEHPDEDKFKRIRRGNKSFQEKVAPVLGAVEFLLAIGYEETEPDDKGEIYFELTDVPPPDMLEAALELLQSDQRVQCPLYRDTRIYRVSDTNGPALRLRGELPAAFYTLTLEDVKRQHQLQNARVDQLLSLRTESMREASKNKSKRVYRFVLLRIRLNADFVLQGVFRRNETTHAVYNFVRDTLQSDTADETIAFTLQAQHDRSKLADDPKLTLAAAQLVPTALLNVLLPSGKSLAVAPALAAQATAF